MKISLNWLQEYVAIDVPVRKLVELLDLSGTKVETIKEPGKGVAGVVVAEVLAIEEHPNADNLTLVDVQIGDVTERVVCGARNFAVGDRVPYAQVGAKLPGLEISERKIRGEVSRGMLCSASELGISKDHSGILVLPASAEQGADVVTLLGLNDTVLELEITPNRPDCMSMVGLAREVAALLGNELSVPAAAVDAASEGPLSVVLKDPDACPRYVAHLIEGVTVGPSDPKIAARLLAGGIRPISNVVDATNYTLLELGHPLHAFDAAKVPGQKIVVRRARKGETLRTLDEIDRKLHPDDLVIADERRAIALAGVMGGHETEVDDATTSVILESAYFDAATIAFTARRHGLRTEASARFERGMDPDAADRAAARCTELIARSASGRTVQVTDAYPRPLEPRRITLRPARTSTLLGSEIGVDSQSRHLRSVGFDVTAGEEALDVAVPTFRPDVTREVDLIEEVARLAGYGRLPSTIPKGDAGGLSPIQATERALRRHLAAAGLAEALTSSLGSSEELDRLMLSEGHPARKMVAIANPMSEEENRMRTSLLPGLLAAVARNASRQVSDVGLFEIARIFEPSAEELPAEPLVLAIAMSGQRRPKEWFGPPVPAGFFAAKGVLESALGSLGVEFGLQPATGMPFHPTRAASITIGGREAGSMGEIHPTVCANLDVPEGTVAVELALAPVFEALPGRVKVKELPKYPPVLLDLAFIVDHDVPAGAIEAEIRSLGAPEVEVVRLFDLYVGEQVPEGKKSLAFSLQMRLSDRTMKDEDAAAVQERIVEGIQGDFGARLRS